MLTWRPVGPEPAPTYWQRRAVVVGALLLVVLFLRAVLTGSDAAETASDAAARPAPTASPAVSVAGPAPSASPAASPAATVACADGSLTVTATAERDSYQVGARPLLVLTVTNTGTAACSRDLGQGAVELLVVSGSDRIWSSDDCAAGGAVKQVVLAPDEPSVTRLTWAGRRSLPGCEGTKAQAVAGTYRVSARLGDLRVDGSAFRFQS